MKCLLKQPQSTPVSYPMKPSGAKVISKHYTSKKLLKNTDYVLCSVSAAEYPGLCNCTTATETYYHSEI